MNPNDKQLHTFVELHIEQGLELKDSKDQIGIVKGIATSLQLKIHLKGVASHTGTTSIKKEKMRYECGKVMHLLKI